MTDNELRIFEKQQLACADVEALLGDYVEDEISPCLKGRVRSHIHHCEACQKNEASYRQVISLAGELRSETNFEPSLEVRNRLRRALNKRLGLELPEIVGGDEKVL